MEQMTFWKNTESVSKEIMELLKTIRGDITKITDVQAIVNAANNHFLVAEVWMEQFTEQQDQNFWKNAEHYMDVRQGRQKLQKHISSLVSMLSIQ